MERLEYKRAARTDAVRTIIQLVLAVLAIAVFQFFIFPMIWRDSPPSFALFWAVIALLFAFSLIFVWFNFKSSGEFVCRIDNGTIECICPIYGFGESFVVKVADLVKIERETGESLTWYLWDAEGRRYWLTTNYGNPAREFVRLIKQLNPEVAEVQT